MTLFNEKFINIMEGVNLSCKVNGAPSLSANWSYPISNDRVATMTTVNGDQVTSTLTIESVVFNDSGEYVCTASTTELTGDVIYNLTAGMLLFVGLVLYVFKVLLTVKLHTLK